ncbi:D-amino-acid transaminase [Sandarakinorhabdus sp. DWP1-3-1]|uniref:D-amino-acid transaminase n=1 Tax=Sandarakinorhabdus sp. DWP1-3-1 TaxID=2804627 RepID=UPI003CE80969
MPQLAYVDGRMVPLRNAMIHVEDRGLQFADSLYEVCAIMNGRLLDWPGHLARLRRGLAALFIDFPMSDAALGIVARRLVAVNGHSDGLLYLQLTRGSARRDHGFPAAPSPSLIMTVRRFDFAQRVRQQATGVSVVTVNDMRWRRVDLKTTGLLANVLAKQDARAAGAFEAWLVAEDGTLREGSSTNAWIVKDGRLLTHPLSESILPGIARSALIDLARGAKIPVDERPFSLAEALAADEALLTSTTAPLLPVVRIDGQAIGTGTPGPIAARLAPLVWGEIERQTGWRA